MLTVIYLRVVFFCVFYALIKLLRPQAMKVYLLDLSGVCSRLIYIFMLAHNNANNLAQYRQMKNSVRTNKNTQKESAKVGLESVDLRSAEFVDFGIRLIKILSVYHRVWIEHATCGGCSSGGRRRAEHSILTR